LPTKDDAFQRYSNILWKKLQKHTEEEKIAPNAIQNTRFWQNGQKPNNANKFGKNKKQEKREYIEEKGGLS